MAEDGRASERGHCLGALFLIPLAMVRLLLTVNYRDFVQAPYGRGTCVVCGREFNLTKKGRVRAHGEKRDAWPPKNCEGSGQYPKDEADER